MIVETKDIATSIQITHITTMDLFECQELNTLKDNHQQYTLTTTKTFDLHMIDSDIYAIDYKYDYKLIKVPSKFRDSEEKSESLQYTFDDKKNPRYYIIPEKLALINPIYLNKNNILEIKDLEGKIIKTYTNTYNSDAI